MSHRFFQRLLATLFLIAASALSTGVSAQFGLKNDAVAASSVFSTPRVRAELVAHALSPAQVQSVTVVDAAARSARVVVPDFQLSLAIGKEGQNARLAARLTGWRIDIHSDEETE